MKTITIYEPAQDGPRSLFTKANNATDFDDLPADVLFFAGEPLSRMEAREYLGQCNVENKLEDKRHWRKFVRCSGFRDLWGTIESCPDTEEYRNGAGSFFRMYVFVYKDRHETVLSWIELKPEEQEFLKSIGCGD